MFYFIYNFAIQDFTILKKNDHSHLLADFPDTESSYPQGYRMLELTCSPTIGWHNHEQLSAS